MGISVKNKTEGSVNVLTTRKWFAPFPSAFAHDKKWDLHPGRGVNMCTFGSWTTVYVWPHTGRDSYPSDLQLGFMRHGRDSYPSDLQLGFMNAIKIAIKASLWLFVDLDGLLEACFGDFVMDWLLEQAIEQRLNGEVNEWLERVRDALNWWRANDRPHLRIGKCEIHFTVGLCSTARSTSRRNAAESSRRRAPSYIGGASLKV